MDDVSRRELLRWLASVVPVSAIAANSTSPQAEPQSVSIRGDHPRLLFTADDVSRIRAKLTAYYGAGSPYPDIRGSFQAAVNECDALYGTISDLASARYYASTYALLANVLPCPGFTSTHSGAQHGAEAARLLQIWLNSTTSLTDGAWPNNMLGFAYDWAFQYLTPSQRRQAVTLMKTLTAAANALYASPWSADSSKHCTCEAMFAASCAGDGFDDAWASAVLGAYGTRIVGPTGVIGAESRVVNLGPTFYGSGPQSGLSYSNYQWQWWVLHAEAVRTAQGMSRVAFYSLADYSILPSTLFWWVYLLRPYAVASSAFPNGKAWSFMRTQYSEPTWDVNQPASTIPAVFAGIWNEVETEPARLAMWYLRQRLSRQPVTGYRLGQQWVYRFLCEDPTIPEASPDELGLPLSARFGDGRFEFKSGWDSGATTNTNWAVRFHASKYLILGDGRGPHHLNGSWEIHRKGPQTIIRGAGSHGWAGHGAFNALYFRDTSFAPPFAEAADYTFRLAGRVLAGSAPGASNRGLDLVPGSQADYLGEVRTAFASGVQDCDYVFADLSAWYPGPKWTNSNNTASVVLYHDHKVLFRPASPNDPVRVVVYRRYRITSLRFEPTFVWNPAGDVLTVDGTETPSAPVRNGSGFGHWTYVNAGRAVALNTVAAGSPAYDGKNVLTVVRPTTRTIVKTGGPDEVGRSFYDDADDGGWYLTSHNYSCEAMDIYGQRFSQNPVSSSNTELACHHGRYSIQIQANTPALAGDFLVVNEVGDSTMAPSPCQHLLGVNFAGVAVLGPDERRIAVFGTLGDTAVGSFVIPTAGTYRCLVANVHGTECEVTGGSNVASVSPVAGGQQPFPVSQAKTLYLNIVVSADGTGAGNTVSIAASGEPLPPPPQPPRGVIIK